MQSPLAIIIIVLYKYHVFWGLEKNPLWNRRSFVVQVSFWGHGYDFFVEARSAAGIGPASATPLLRAFAASKASAPQNFAIDLQALSTGTPMGSWR
jgi:hypothetical protein